MRYYEKQIGSSLTMKASEQRSGATWITVSMGGSGLSSAVCSFGADGQVDELGTEVQWLGWLTHEVGTCLNATIKKWDPKNARFTDGVDDCGERAVSVRAGSIRNFDDGYLERQFGRK
jgi:hypothetical protein